MAATKSTARDSRGKKLTDYPRPSVAVDTALLTVDPDEGLQVLQVRRDGTRGWALPGTFLHQGERLIDAVQRSLREKAGVEGLVPTQLQVFDDPDRDDRGWVLSVAHLSVVPIDRLANRLDSTRLVSADAPGRLPYGHGSVVALAVDEVRAQYASAPDPFALLGRTFTMLDLRRVHEAVAGEALQKDTFRRAMEQQLTGTGQMTAGTRGRPAEVFRRG